MIKNKNVLIKSAKTKPHTGHKIPTVPLQRPGNPSLIKCRKLAPVHDSKSSPLKVRCNFKSVEIITRGTLHIYLNKASWWRCFSAPSRCERTEDARGRPWGCSLPVGAAVRHKALSKLSLPLPQTGGNWRTSHQPPRLGSCRSPPQVSMVHTHTFWPWNCRARVRKPEVNRSRNGTLYNAHC